MHVWDDRLVVNKLLKNNIQEIILIDTKTEKIKEFVTCRDSSLYCPMGKYLIRKDVKEISIFEARVQVDHFDCIWSKEVHELMKKLNIELPQKCDSIIYNDVTLPKSIVWFLNVNWGVTNCRKYCGEIIEESEDEEMNSDDEINYFGQTFCFSHILEIETPDFMRKWMENNKDGIILGSCPSESVTRANYYIATKTSECIGEEFPLYLIKRNHEIEIISLFEFLSRSRPVMATFIASNAHGDGFECGVFEFNYLACIRKLKDDNIICNGKIDTRTLLSAYRDVDDYCLHRLSTIPKEILISKIEFEGNYYLCRDLIVLAFQHAAFTTNFLGQ